MSIRFRPSVLAATGAFVGALAWAGVARADHTPACGGDGQPVCKTQRAKAHGKAKNVGCPSGSFFDPRNFGECWTCSGKVRTVHAVTSASACGAHVFDGKGTRARFVRSLWGCGKGQFFDLVDGGSCWSCPSGTYRGITHVKSATACPVSPASVCDAGMERTGDRCQPSRETQVRQEAAKVFTRHSGVIARAVALALGLDGRADILGPLGGQDADAIATVKGSRAYRDAAAGVGPSFETITVGAATSATVIGIGGSAETGIAIDLAGERPVYWYGGSGYQVGPGLSVEAGVSVGLWTSENNALTGDSQGVVLGLSDLAKLGPLLDEGLDFKPGPSISVALWFSYPDARGDIELLGVTVTPSVSAGAALGSYVRATTVQVP